MRASEVIRGGLRAFQTRDKVIEQWLGGKVGAIYDAMKADPARARLSADAFALGFIGRGGRAELRSAASRGQAPRCRKTDVQVRPP